MPTVVLTEELKAKVRHHMGNPNTAQTATFALGVPAQLETTFLLETAMNKLLPAGLTELQRLLGILDALEEQMIGDHELAAANKIGEIEVNQKEQAQLTERYDYWVGALENLLTVPRNPLDRRKASRSINARVTR